MTCSQEDINRFAIINLGNSGIEDEGLAVLLTKISNQVEELSTGTVISS